MILFPIQVTFQAPNTFLSILNHRKMVEVEISVCSLSPLPATAAAKSLQSCLTLCNPMDCSPPGSPVPGILQARTLEWVAISFSNAWKWKVKGKSLSRVWLLATPWTAAYRAFPSMRFFRREYWSGVLLPSPSQVVLVVKNAPSNAGNCKSFKFDLWVEKIPLEESLATRCSILAQRIHGQKSLVGYSS